jgi:hypothetical protein
MPDQARTTASTDNAARPADIAPHPEPHARQLYTPARLEPLGAWSALTLQQSIPLFP